MIRKSMMALGMAVSLVGAFSAAASARSGAAALGDVANGNNAVCAVVANGTFKNGCTDNRTITWEATLPVDLNGSYDVQISVTSVAGKTVSCKAYSVNADGSTNDAAGTAKTLTGAATASLALDRVSVPVSGSLNVFCHVPQGAKINTINWNLAF